ncbi:MAG: hypothetical protein ACJ74T_19760 [Pyrinomonadaceae bacterium]
MSMQVASLYVELGSIEGDGRRRVQNYAVLSIKRRAGGETARACA